MGRMLLGRTLLDICASLTERYTSVIAREQATPPGQLRLRLALVPRDCIDNDFSKLVLRMPIRGCLYRQTQTHVSYRLL